MGRFVTVLLGVLAAGCVSASVQHLSQGLRPPCLPEAIEVLEEAPECPYTVIAHVESRSGAIFHSPDDLRRKLVEEAAELGGDALILGSVTTYDEPIFVATGMVMSQEKRLEADVIVFDRSETAGAPAGS